MLSDLAFSNKVAHLHTDLPCRAAIILGKQLYLPDGITPDQIYSTFSTIFSSINVDVRFMKDLDESPLGEIVAAREYDLIGLIGRPSEFNFRKPSSVIGHVRRNHSRQSQDRRSLLLAFVPDSQFGACNEYLKISDGVILCEAKSRPPILDVISIAYRLFESLSVPSMLNIDLADLTHIARGIGRALNLAENDYLEIISKLPPHCLVARSALLHFSCTEDVKLNEVYSISRTIALKRGASENPSVEEKSAMHSEAKWIRRVNVKMGIRVKPRLDNASEKVMKDHSLGVNSEIDLKTLANDSDKRINLTAILFGL